MGGGRGRSGGRGATYRCYRCNKLGHRSFEYLENEEARHHAAHVVQGEEKDIDPQIMENVPDMGEVLVMRKVLLNQVKEANGPTQWKTLFRIVCKVQGKYCKVINDSGRTDNLVSIEVIERLNLQKTSPISCKVSWLQNGHQLLVSDQCEIELKIGNYKDTLLCDVMPMDVCRILLGRPWQYDRSAKHDGRKNAYELEKDWIKHKLLPL